MVKQLDFILNESGLQVYNGDLLTGDSTLQHQEHLLLSGKGVVKNHPTVGVGLIAYLNDDLKAFELESEIAIEFEKDGMRVNKVNVESAEDAEIDAYYED